MGPSELLAHVVSVFEKLGIPYLVTGSVAAMAYGEPRLTNDIDIVAGIAEQHIPGLREAFPAEEYYLYEDAIRDAIHRAGQFNIIHPASGLKIAIIIRRDTPFDRSRFGRARRIHPAETFEADFAAPEDMIIKKMEYYREGGSEKHLRDITGILLASADDVDRAYIEQWGSDSGSARSGPPSNRGWRIVTERPEKEPTACLVVDVKGIFDRAATAAAGVRLWRM